MYGTSLGGRQDGAVVADTSGQLAAVHSTSSGSTLVVPLGGGRMVRAVRDPISGAVLAVTAGGTKAAPAAKRLRQPQVHSRRFYLASAAEVAIEQLRCCPPVSRYTNERVCGAGRITGSDPTLSPGGISPHRGRAAASPPRRAGAPGAAQARSGAAVGGVGAAGGASGGDSGGTH